MLSRIAESLYWIGRYIERADDTCRLLDVHLQLMIEDPTTDPQESASTLFTILGARQPAGAISSNDVLAAVRDDPTSPCSLLTSLRNARESARRARETVPPEMWESINTTWNAVRSGQLRQMRPTAGLTFVRERCALIAGMADWTMSHDEGWQFLHLGRSIEQIDMNARLLMWAASPRQSPSVWNNALRAGGAMHAFRRNRGAATLSRDAVEFLLLDRLFPRSVVYSIAAAEDALAVLEPGSQRIGFQSEAVRLLGRARVELEYQPLPEVVGELPARLASLQAMCAAVGDAITKRYFVGASAPAWSEGAE